MINQLVSRDIILYFSVKRLGFGMLHFLTLLQLSNFHLYSSISDTSILLYLIHLFFILFFPIIVLYLYSSFYQLHSQLYVALKMVNFGIMPYFGNCFHINTFRILEFIFEIVFDYCLVLIIVLFSLQAHSTQSKFRDFVQTQETI